jgi:TPR repeat protein
MLLAIALALSAASVGVVQSTTQEASLRAASDAGDVTARRDLALHLTQSHRQSEAAQLLEDALADGDRQAAPLLAAHLLEFGGPEDLRRASDLARRYASDADPELARQLGLRLATRALDPELPHSDRQALAASALILLRPSYTARDVDALWHVGYLGAVGLPRPLAIDGPLASIELAADRGHGSAAAWLARYYLDAKLAPVDPQRGIQALTTAARAGHTQAMTELADRYATGQDVPQDARISRFWSEQARAHHGILQPLTVQIPQPDSLRQLAAGPMTQVASLSAPASAPTAVPSAPSSLTAELAQARTTIRELTLERDQLRTQLTALQSRYQALLADHEAAQLDARALNERGLQAYRVGDFESALPLFRRAAEAGYAPAQSNLAVHYLNGQAVPQDLRQAVALFVRASEQGHLPATENLAVLFDYGLGVHQDSSRAISFYQRAVLQGSTSAQAALARLKPSRS